MLMANRPSLSPYAEDPERSFSAPPPGAFLPDSPDSSAQQRKDIERLLRETGSLSYEADYERRYPAARELPRPASVSWSMAKELGEMPRSRSTMEVPTRLPRGDRFSLYDDAGAGEEGGEEGDAMRSTLETLSASIAALRGPGAAPAPQRRPTAQQQQQRDLHDARHHEPGLDARADLAAAMRHGRASPTPDAEGRRSPVLDDYERFGDEFEFVRGGGSPSQPAPAATSRQPPSPPQPPPQLVPVVGDDGRVYWQPADPRAARHGYDGYGAPPPDFYYGHAAHQRGYAPHMLPPPPHYAGYPPPQGMRMPPYGGAYPAAGAPYGAPHALGAAGRSRRSTRGSGRHVSPPGAPPGAYGAPPYAPPPPQYYYGSQQPLGPGGKGAGGRGRRGGPRQRGGRGGGDEDHYGYDEHPPPASPPYGGRAAAGSAAAMFAQCSPGESVRGRVAQLCRDQHGSRYLQAHLDGHLDEPAELEIIFEEVLAKARELTTDVFGNYVVQKVLATGDATVRARVAEALKGQAVALSLHVYGCRVIQKALEALPAAQAIEVIKEFQGNVLLCVHDVNGQARRPTCVECNHVIQKCVEVTSNARKAHDAGDVSAQINARTRGRKDGGGEAPDAAQVAEVGLLGDQIDFVLAAFVGQARSLAVHPYGCRVLQRVLEHCARAQTARLLGELRGGDLRALIEDQYANYVMQHAIQFGRPEDRALLVAAVRASLADFSRHKFASNVVEKCLEFGSEEERRDLIDEIVADRGGDDGQESSMLRLLITDPFANYVVQKVVDLADEAQVAAIAARLRPVAQHVRHTPGKHILSRLEKKVAIKF